MTLKEIIEQLDALQKQIPLDEEVETVEQLLKIQLKSIICMTLACGGKGLLRELMNHTSAFIRKEFSEAKKYDNYENN